MTKQLPWYCDYDEYCQKSCYHNVIGTLQQQNLGYCLLVKDDGDNCEWRLGFVEATEDIRGKCHRRNFHLRL